MKCSAVIVAAGNGSRMESEMPKQFMELDGRPMIYYSVKAYSEIDFIDEIIIVTSEKWIEYCRDELVAGWDFKKDIFVAEGGETRTISVLYGLTECDAETDYVFIHDAARPFVTKEIIERGLEAVMKHSAAIAALPSSDTVRITDENGVVKGTPERKNVWRMQTPQVFDYQRILKAYAALTAECGEGLTDDGMVWELAGNEPLELFLGDECNIKITTPGDMDVAAVTLAKGGGERQ